VPLHFQAHLSKKVQRAPLMCLHNVSLCLQAHLPKEVRCDSNTFRETLLYTYSIDAKLQKSGKSALQISSLGN